MPRKGLTQRERLASGIYHSGLLAALRGITLGWELCGSAAPFLSPRPAEPRFVILCYHRIGVGGVPLYSTLEPLIFDAQMQYLRRHYRVLSLNQMLGELENPLSTAPAVAVTFDDGYGDLFANAFPILRKYEIPATIFAIAQAIETGMAPWYDRLFLGVHVYPAPTITVDLDVPTEFRLENSAARLAATEAIVRWLRTQPDSKRRDFCADLSSRLPVPESELRGRMLTWDQLRTMQAAGIVSGSHTLTHPVLSQVDRESLVRELLESREIMEMRLGQPVRDFAFPFGHPTDCAGVTEMDLSACGYRAAATMTSGTNRLGANRYALRRVSIGEQRHLPLFAYRLNNLFLRVGSIPSAATSLPALPMAATAVTRGEGR
jgi:peptidoglycan/xylan/chitin deacetylase (PgdA/CDA1 family)